MRQVDWAAAEHLVSPFSSPFFWVKWLYDYGFRVPVRDTNRGNVPRGRHGRRANQSATPLPLPNQSFCGVPFQFLSKKQAQALTSNENLLKGVLCTQSIYVFIEARRPPQFMESFEVLQYNLQISRTTVVLLHKQSTENFGSSKNIAAIFLWLLVAAALHSVAATAPRHVALKGTQEWEFLWLRFWILYCFIASYAEKWRLCKKKFLIGPLWGEVGLFSVVLRLRGMKIVYNLGFQKKFFWIIYMPPLYLLKIVFP